MVVSSWFGDHNSLYISSVPKDVYFDKQAADADQKKEDASRKHPKQRNDVCIMCVYTPYMYMALHVDTGWVSSLYILHVNLLEVEMQFFLYITDKQ